MKKDTWSMKDTRDTTKLVVGTVLVVAALRALKD